MYKHGIYPSESATEMSEPTVIDIAQVVIGTAPVHMTENPSAAVNKPILCKSMREFKNKLGYSDDFKKYTTCQSAFVSFEKIGIAPLVFINVLDPEKHFEAVEPKEYQVNENSITINDDVIVSSLKITAANADIEADKYVTEWINGALVINFVDNVTGNVSVGYNKIAPGKVTETDIIGSWDTDTDERTGTELIKNIFPSLGVVPFIITAPGWSKNDMVGAILSAKSEAINGCYKAISISDIDTAKAKSRTAAIAEKQSRTLDKNSIAVFPMIKKDGYIIAYSAYLAAVIMYQAAQKNGITCQSPSNQKLDIDNVVLEDGTPVYYDQVDGNELNAEGIVTVIARNGWYTWGNDTAAYPKTKDPVERRIMTRLSFFWIENDFINSYFSMVDGALSPKMVESCVTDENIKLASFAAIGYIAGGKIRYNADDNSSDDILNGHFTFKTSLAGNIPGESFDNIFSFDIETLRNVILGGAA